MTQRAGGSSTLAPLVRSLIGKIRHAYIETVGPLEVWHVNGRLIRDRVYIDFTEGGNSRAYVWMPPNNIWLDHDIDPGEVDFVKLHELHEWNKMGDGMGYDNAHESANGVEGEARRDPSKTSALWRAEIARIKPERKGQIS
jgi:hypothetical protein